MITHIHVENYKAFESADIPIRPFTVFLGENSVGKSSIIQLLLILQQTAERDRESYESALVINGDSTQRGSSKYLFHNFDISKPITISINFRSQELTERIRTLHESFVTELKRIALYVPLMGLQDWASRSFSTENINFRILELYNSVSRIVSQDNDKKATAENIDKYFISQNSFISALEIKRGLAHKSTAVSNFLIKLRDIISQHSDPSYSVSFSFKSNNEDSLYVSTLTFRINGEIILYMNFDEREIEIYSELLEDVEFDPVDSVVNKNAPIFQLFADDTERVVSGQPYPNSVAKTIRYIMDYVLYCLSQEFTNNKLCHVSPIRAIPQRYYILDKASKIGHLNTMNGEEIALVLKGNRTLTLTVNRWLEKFHVKISMSKVAEVIYKMKVKNTLRESDTSFELDLSDVGFGISQVLPIIVQGFLSNNNRMMMIEQPEIHLHPQMQADLADLFIEMINLRDEKRSFIIETHSEYLLKRLHRRMHDFPNKKEGGISSEDVSICLFKKDQRNGNAIVETITIDKDGSFPWPEELFLGELLKDTFSLI